MKGKREMTKGRERVGVSEFISAPDCPLGDEGEIFNGQVKFNYGPCCDPLQ